MLLEEVLAEEREEGGDLSILDDITQQVEEEVERRLGREMQWAPSAQVLCGGERRTTTCGEMFMPCAIEWSSSTIAPLLVTSGS